MKKVPRKQTIIYMLIGFVYCAFALTLAVMGWMQVTDKGETLVENAKILTGNLYQLQRYSEIVNLMESTEDDRERLLSNILFEKDFVSFLSDIESLVAKAGAKVKVNQINVNELEKSEGLSILGLNLTVEGNQDQVMLILELLENLPYQSTVKDINYRKQSFSGATIGEYSVTINLDMLLI